MARMYPPEVADHIKSDAERRLFAKIEADLDDTWAAYHSLGIANHRRKPWAEIDFVLVGPTGVFCIEVKGGRVRRMDGVWEFENRHGEIATKREGPFDQVGSASAALANYLFDREPALRKGVIGYGVAIPDMSFKQDGPDVVREALYDVDDDAAPFVNYLKRLAEYWHTRLENQRGRQPSNLDETLQRRVEQAIRGDFDYRPSLRARALRIRETLDTLTHEQYQVLEALEDNERVLVKGSAGTGKTLLAVEEAVRSSRNNDRVLLTCFNKNLASFLSAAIGDLPGVTVRHFHSFMAQVTNEAGIQHRLPDASEQDLFTRFYPEVALEALLATEKLGSYDMLIVDEGQDLLQPGYLDVMDGLLDGGLERGRWRIFLDPAQNIYNVLHSAGMNRVLSHAPAQYRLKVNCRNTQPIAMTTDLISGISSEALLKVDGPRVEEDWYRDLNHQRRMVSRRINEFLSRGFRGDDIQILGQRRLESSGLANGLDGVSYPLVTGASETATRAIHYSTISSFKGLEADIVLVIDIDDLTTPTTLAEWYVATSRARTTLTLSLHERVRADYEALAVEFGRRIAIGTTSA